MKVLSHRRWALLAALAFAFGCAGGEPVAEPVPKRAPAQTWLQTLIDEVLAATPTNPPAQIISYRYRGQLVHYRPPYCCDVQGVVFDEHGAVLCHPDGGFTGNGDGRCADFAHARSDCAVVWRDPRTKAAATDPCDRPATPTSSER